MAQYQYKTILFKDTSSDDSIAKATPSPTNDADRTDFETNYKSTAVEVSEVIILETTFVTEKSYADFKSIVSDWANVNYIESDACHNLILISGSPL